MKFSKAATAAVVLILLLVSCSNFTSRSSRVGSGGGTISTTGKTNVTSKPVINVVSYGADPSGKRDSTSAISNAINMAQTQPGSEVFFPPGHFLLDDPSKHQVDFKIDRQIHIVGSGPTKTVIVNELGALNPAALVSTTIFEIVTNPVTQKGDGDGTTISGMTLDSATYNAGTSIMDFANHTTLSDQVVDAPRSSNAYNPNAFGVRVIAICNPTNKAYVVRTGNLVENVTISGNGSSGQTELDISCQRNSKVTNVTIKGNGVDIFYCSHDELSNLNLIGTPSNTTSPNYTWVITGSSYITLSNIDTYGSGGVIAPDISDISKNITITNETMRGTGAFMAIGDSLGTTITKSHLEQIRLNPVVGITGIDLVDSSYTGVVCKPDKSMSALVGLSCPTISTAASAAP